MWMVKLCWAAPKHRVWNSCMNSGCFADCLDQAWKWGGCHNGSGCIAQCAGNSHDGEQFQPLDGTEWEALVWLPVTPKPITIEVSAKAQGARGISEELERVCFSLIRLYKNGNTIPQMKKTVPPHDVSSCQSIKTDVVVELPDSGGQVNQVAEEEPRCWCHLGKGELTNEREQFPLGCLVLG
eukprot:Em0709g1a